MAKIRFTTARKTPPPITAPAPTPIVQDNGRLGLPAVQLAPSPTRTFTAPAPDVAPVVTRPVSSEIFAQQFNQPAVSRAVPTRVATPVTPFAPPEPAKPPVPPVPLTLPGPPLGELAQQTNIEAQRANPWGGLARPDFQADTMVPINADEARRTQQWFANVANAGTFLTIQQTANGAWINTAIPDPANTLGGGYKAATAEEIQGALRRQQFLATAADVLSRDADFRKEFALNQLVRAETASENELKLALDQKLKAIDTETARQAAIALERAEIDRIKETGAQARLTAKEEHTQKLDQIAEEGLEKRFTAELQYRFDITLQERRGEIDEALQNARLQQAAAQAQLDRELRSFELVEANRSALVAENLRGQQVELEKQQFKLSIFQTLASSPEILFFLDQRDMVAQFGDLVGDGGRMLQEVLTQLKKTPPVNIQQFAGLSAQEQGIERFRIGATTGETDITKALRGEAPRAVIGQTNFTEPIQPGAPSTADRARLRRPRVASSR